MFIGDFCACIPYVFEPILYLKLRISMPTLPRPFRSPFGYTGAVLNLLIATAALLSLVITDQTWQWIFLGWIIFFLLCIPFYFLVVRKNLKNSPEKVFIKRRLKEQSEGARMKVSASALSVGFQSSYNIQGRSSNIQVASETPSASILSSSKPATNVKSKINGATAPNHHLKIHGNTSGKGVGEASQSKLYAESGIGVESEPFGFPLRFKH